MEGETVRCLKINITVSGRKELFNYQHTQHIFF